VLIASVYEWLCQNSTPFESTNPQSQLSEREKGFLDKIIQSAEVISLGEMTHGSKEVFCSKDRLLRYLIENHGISVVVLEANQGSTCELNDCILSGQGNLASALAKTGFWSIANKETYAFFQWLVKYNSRQSSLEKRVKVLGCDIQSLDDCKREVSHLVRQYADEAVVTKKDCNEIFNSIAELPKDLELNAKLEPFFEELGSEEPDPGRLSYLQAQQADLIDAVKQKVSHVGKLLGELEPAIQCRATEEECFFFRRYIRLLEQCLDHYRLDDGGRVRDQHMAENILALRDFFLDQKIVLISANWHVSRVPIPIEGTEDYVTMGSLLAEELGEKYCVMGSAFYEGNYLGTAGDSSPVNDVIVDAHRPRSDTFEFSLNEFAKQTNTPGFLVDFEPNRRAGQTFPWPLEIRMNIGESGAKNSYDATFLPQRPSLQFDALLFFSQTTPTTVLPEYYVYSKNKWGK